MLRAAPLRTFALIAVVAFHRRHVIPPAIKSAAAIRHIPAIRTGALVQSWALINSASVGTASLEPTPSLHPGAPFFIRNFHSLLPNSQ
jgi:hypothetical protein